MGMINWALASFSANVFSKMLTITLTITNISVVLQEIVTAFIWSSSITRIISSLGAKAFHFKYWPLFSAVEVVFKWAEGVGRCTDSEAPGDKLVTVTKGEA